MARESDVDSRATFCSIIDELQSPQFVRSKTPSM